MRPAKQIKVVTLQLEVLEDLKIQLEDLLRSICHVIQVGESWLEETDNKTFTEIYQFLANQTADCISKCSAIPDEGKDVCRPDDIIKKYVEENTPETVPVLQMQGEKELSKLLLRFEDMENSITVNSQKIETLNQKLKEHEESTNESISMSLEEINSTNNKEYKKIIDELQAESSFMADLQNETKSLSQQMDERATPVGLLDQTESNLFAEFDEMKVEISRTNESVRDLKSFCETLSNKVSDLYISLEEQILLRSQARTSQTIAENVKNKGDNTKYQLEDIQNKLQSTNSSNVELRSEFKLMTCRLEELQKNFELTILLIDPLKKEVVDISASVTTLKDSLDEQEKIMKDNDEKVNTVSVQLINLSETIAEMNRPISFYVGLDSDRTIDLKASQKVACFNHEIYNEGQHFNQKTGTFLVPCSGLYLCSMVMDINKDADIKFHIYVKKKYKRETIKCRTRLTKRYTMTSVVCPIAGMEGDKIYIRSEKDCFNLEVSHLSYFACVLIKTFPN